MQARVLGYVFNPISLYWCHDAGGTVRHIIAEVHNTYGGRHAYLLPPDSDQPAIVMKKLYVSPFNDVDGHYLVRAPRPDENLDVRISLHRDNQPAFVATLRGTRRRAGIGELLRLQLVAPLAPLMGAIGIRIQGITLWLRRVPVVPRTDVTWTKKGSSSRDHRTDGNYQGHNRFRQMACRRARAPSGPVSAAAGAIADRLFRRAAARLPIRVVYPDGTVVGAADPTLPTMVVHRPDAMVRRVGRYGLIGFGESYMAGDWSSTDLAGLLTEFAKRLAELIPPVLQRFRPLAVVRQPRSQHNSRRQARRNIAEHYDLSNDLFAEFLDETMTYSSALFDSLPAGQSCLADAQRRKIDRLLDSAGVGHGQPSARDRHRLGRTVHPRRGARRTRPLDHPVGRAAATGPSAGGRGGTVRPRRDRPVRLPRRRRPLRRRAVGRDDRGGRIPVLAHVLSDSGPAGHARRPGRDSGDHHAARPDAGQPQHPYLDPEVHLPRRTAAVDRGDHRDHRARRPGCARSTCSRCDRTTPRHCGCGASVSSSAGMRWRSWASTMCSTGCGSCTWRTPRPDSGPAISTSTSGRSRRQGGGR